MTDFIIAVILLAMIGAAAWYVIRAKRSGAKCIGCSVDGGCPHKKKSSCGCGEDGECSCHSCSK